MRTLKLGLSVIAALGVGMIFHALELEQTPAVAATPTISVSPEALHMALSGRELLETRVDSYN
jgi:hypothetical protein